VLKNLWLSGADLCRLCKKPFRNTLTLVPVTHGRQKSFGKDGAVNACVGDEPLSFVGDKPRFNQCLKHLPKTNHSTLIAKSYTLAI
jgi:hypothetical protein